MTTRPQWSPVEDDTADLLTLVRDEGHPSADHEWTAWLAAVRTVATPDGRVDPNALRREVRGVIAPKRLGAFCNRALAAGLLIWRGDWVVSDDHEGRNGGKPCRQYETMAFAAHAPIEPPGPEGGWATATINGHLYKARVAPVPVTEGEDES